MFIEVEQQAKEIGIKKSYSKNKNRRLKLFTNIVNNLTYLQKKKNNYFFQLTRKYTKSPSTKKNHTNDIKSFPQAEPSIASKHESSI